MTKVPSHGPLAGLKVTELSHVMAGPTRGMMLADMVRRLAADGAIHPGAAP